MAVRASFIDLKPPVADFRAEILAGLSAPRKTSSAKFFYDAEGSRLFELIGDLAAYYLTRTECGILVDQADTLRSLLPADATVIEFGSGSTRKIDLLSAALDNMRGYVPIDISRDYLRDCAEGYAIAHPNLEVTAICADFTQPIDLGNILDDTPRIGFFPGSTIGNLSPAGARAFLRDAAFTLGEGGHLVVGADLQKDRGRLISAYDDDEGVTAAFNLNLLTRINNELDGNFRLDQFKHLAFFNEDEARIEMHLQSLKAQTVLVSGRPFDFASGETIHTENSHKYTIGGFQDMALEGGYVPVASLTDAENLFSVHVLRVSAG